MKKRHKLVLGFLVGLTLVLSGCGGENASVPVATRKAITASQANVPDMCTCIVKLAVGDVVRAHTDSAPANATDIVQFAIRKIGNY